MEYKNLPSSSRRSYMEKWYRELLSLNGAIDGDVCGVNSDCGTIGDKICKTQRRAFDKSLNYKAVSLRTSFSLSRGMILLDSVPLRLLISFFPAHHQGSYTSTFTPPPFR